MAIKKSSGKLALASVEERKRQKILFCMEQGKEGEDKIMKAGIRICFGQMVLYNTIIVVCMLILYRSLKKV